jgi:TetR/AcrR family fatty acid metabolism transcriptional regulator
VECLLEHKNAKRLHSVIGYISLPLGSEGEMERKRALQVDSKKRLILKVANEIFNEESFERTTVSQIAKGANISNGSIYNYFKNKEDILFSIPEERMENFLSGVHEHLKGIKDAPNKLRKLIWYQLNFYESNKDYTRLLLLDLRQNPRFNQSKAYSMIRQYSKMILEILEEGRKEKTIRKEIDPYIVRDLIFGGIEHLVIRGLVMGRFSKIQEIADDFCDLILSGVAEKDRRVTLTLEELMDLKGFGKGKPKNYKGHKVK